MSDESLSFEHMMRRVFGDKAHQIAGGVRNPKIRKLWIIKLLKQFLKSINQIDTIPKHKNIIIYQISSLEKPFKAKKLPDWEMVDKLIFLCISLFGYGFVIPAYYQMPPQLEIPAKKFLGGHENRKNFLEKRKEIISHLKKRRL